MTRPTDDELEALAQYHDWREDGDSQTAAMLRACKSGSGQIERVSLADVESYGTNSNSNDFPDTAPDHSDWNAAIEAAIVNLKTYSPRKEDAGPEYDIGYVAGYRTALNRVSALEKGPPDDWRKYSTKTEDGYNG